MPAWADEAEKRNKAATPEDKRALERMRDEIDFEMRESVRVLDAEIQALQRENEELRMTMAR